MYRNVQTLCKKFWKGIHLKKKKTGNTRSYHAKVTAKTHETDSATRDFAITDTKKVLGFLVF